MKVDSAADQTVLQSESNLFSIWVDRLGLTLNLDKCHSITFTNYSRSTTNKTYFINGLLLTQVSQILKDSNLKDFSILYTSSLSFDRHIDSVIPQVLKVLRFIKLKTKHCLCSLYFALVRSIIEYGVVEWHSYLENTNIS